MTERYTEADIQVLTGLEAVRQRPGMYVGSTGPFGIAHLAFELVNLGLSEHRRGRASRIAVATGCGALSVAHDGDGLPAEVLDQGFTELHRLHPTVHTDGERLGLGVVSALSSALVAVSDRERRLQRVFAQGRAVTPTLDLGPAPGRGSALHLVPDASIFGGAALPVDLLRTRLQEHAVLHPDLAIELDGQRVPSYGGLLGYARHLAGRPIRAGHARREHPGATIEVAVAWGPAGRPPEALAWANGLESDGPHLAGLREGLGATREGGRTALVAVTLAEAVFDGRVGRRLRAHGAPQLRRWVREVTVEAVDAAVDAPRLAVTAPLRGKGRRRAERSDARGVR